MRFGKGGASSTTTYTAIGPSQYHWRPGLQHLPFKGLGALLLALAGVVVSIAILLASNGADVRRWRFQPTVYLSIASTLTNVTITFALLEGVTIAWWHRALKGGTTVGDLHRIWAFGNSFLLAAWSGRHFNLIALASILVALTPINGPLLQRASTLSNATVTAQQDLDLQVNHLVPRGFTAIVSGRGDEVNMLTTNFSPIARGYYNRAPINLQSGCTGTCRTSILGAGFHTNCSSYRVPFNVTPIFETDGSIIFPNPVVFGANILFDVGENPTTASLNVQYKPDPGCAGELSITNCTLRAGTVLYPVIIDGVASTVTFDTGSSIWDDVAVGNPDSLPGETHLTGTTTYGGIFLALANQYNTDLSFSFGGAIGYQFEGAQSEASIAYARGIEQQPSCDVYFTDPLADFLAGARELIFRTAVAAANSSNTQHVNAQAFGNHTVYQTDYLFMALATLASLLGIFSVLCTFHGSWEIGRRVSMSPVETAKAFNAPLLRSSDSNASAETLLKQVGHRPVKYGLVSDVRSGGESTISHDEDAYRDTPYNSGGLDAAYSPHPSRRYTAFQNPSGSDFELLSPQQGAGVANVRLELADPKKITPL
ncbi:uncharacterized protein Z520_02123 [Fonsecaea multimorphosa CBS 102226]|uniref:Uncharacterized protein n=1 Tax=Fonsecaea multimorphosa CBS 102226 TaxID=1442371 RepID=A0A0D2KF38_9EURO|nr:uncharacterized protein Z520_02123 [Fonsecaea multimorphosa CBS 102226]KIY01985.1 hypothetical protein Z520_02123 [Fonsecaea multimorphosa CBS 102226]OAL29667.1 hypothetical protein AYO22_02081 [Fonsecaea multimorphosa]